MNYTCVKYTIISYLSALFILLSLVSSTLAQDFEVAPVFIEFHVAPGNIETRTLTVRNHAAVAQDMVLKLGDFELDENGSRVMKEIGTSSHSIADMVTLNPSFVTLQPNEERTIEVIMRVPQNATNTRWGSIYIEAAKEQKLGDVDKAMVTGIRVMPRIVVIVTQAPPGSTNYAGKISNLKEVTKPGDANRSFEALISNTGDNIFDAKVYLALANLSTGAEIKMDPIKTKVFPGQKRKIILNATKPIPPGRYALAAIMDYSKFAPIEGTQIMLEVK